MEEGEERENNVKERERVNKTKMREGEEEGGRGGRER